MPQDHGPALRRVRDQVAIEMNSVRPKDINLVRHLLQEYVGFSRRMPQVPPLLLSHEEAKSLLDEIDESWRRLSSD